MTRKATLPVDPASKVKYSIFHVLLYGGKRWENHGTENAKMCQFLHRIYCSINHTEFLIIIPAVNQIMAMDVDF